MIQKLEETKQNAVNLILEAEVMEKMLDKTVETTDEKSYRDREVPYGVIEMIQSSLLEEKLETQNKFFKSKENEAERNLEEKEKIRKHYKNIIVVMIITFGIVMTSFAGATAYLVNNFMNKVDKTVADFMNNYDVFSYQQDGDGFNNIVGKSGEQGDVNYEPAAEDN